MPQPPDNLARQLRAAVLAGDHARAECLVRDYSQALRAFWESLTAEERAASNVPGQVHELLGWAREMTLVQRALTAQHLEIVETASRYETTSGTTGRFSAIEVHA